MDVSLTPPFNYGSPQPHPGGSSYLPYGAPAASVPGYPPNAPVMGGNAPPIGFNPLVLEGAGTSCFAQLLWQRPSLTILSLLALQRFACYPQAVAVAQPSFPNQLGQYYLVPASGQYLWLWFCLSRPLLYHQGFPAMQLSFPNLPCPHRPSGQYYPPPPPLNITYTYLLQQQLGRGSYVMIGTAIALGCVGLGYVLGSNKGGSGGKGPLVSIFWRNFGLWF